MNVQALSRFQHTLSEVADEHPRLVRGLLIGVAVLALLILVGLLSSNRSALYYTSKFILGGRENGGSFVLKQPGVTPIQRFERVQESAGGAPLEEGNRVTVLSDGPETFDAMLAAIDAAENHINLESYIIDDGAIAERFADRLIAAARRGVEVNVLYDNIGSFGTDEDLFERLEEAGVRVEGFQDMIDLQFWRVNQRNHRKQLIIDGRLGFIGGINISKTYRYDSEQAGSRKVAEKAAWRDTHARIEGPAVATMQVLFLDTWLNSGRRTRAEVEYFPPLEIEGAVAAGIVSAKRTDNESRIIDSYLAAIQNARERVWITQAYFIPHHEFVQSLIDAAQRGVDVQLILPAYTDSALAFHASQAHYTPLLKGGVRIHEHTESLLHAKTAVVDGLWSTVGSSNLDIRSLEHNNEANLVAVDYALAVRLEEMFRADRADSREIFLEEWEQRGLWKQLRERLALLFKYWL